MPGARPRIKPLSAGGPSRSSLDEVSELELHLQRQLEEDIARIFDESIYSDLEVVCGKLKILTHSCILKARTHKFYHKLESILHVNIGRNTFDEIYSFISDAYTECDVHDQEKDIIRYLNNNIESLQPACAANDKRNKQEELDESDAYATPNCVSPDDSSLHKTLSSSPSTELTKEYYALVPIEGHILDKELIEQDELSSAFQSFIQLRTDKSNDYNITQCIKPTTLSLNSSHLSKTNKHSNNCDILKGSNNSCLFENDKNIINNVTSQVRKHISEINKSSLVLKKSFSCETAERGCFSDPTFSPDSLVADEASSSSDYLSAAHSASPGPPSSHDAGVAARDTSKMNNTYNVSDSGIDNNETLESLNGHKDVTLTDVSLTESTFHDLLNDESMNSHDSACNTLERHHLPKPKSGAQTSLASAYKPIADMSGKSSKDEKQRQNEEIVIMESSSLSSETGSWESVFPPKMPEKDVCEKFLNIERQNCIGPEYINPTVAVASTNMSFQCPDVAQKSPYKSTACFIDAASLLDEEEILQEQVKPINPIPDNIFRSPSRPVPCVSKQDVSPLDFSESNDNDDSLEQPDPDSIQKDISPTIFEMSLIPEESYAGDDICKETKESEQQSLQGRAQEPIQNNLTTVKTIYTSTPHNSIISLQPSDMVKTFDSEGSDHDAACSKSRTAIEKLKNQTEDCSFPPIAYNRQDTLEGTNKNFRESSPIISGGASIEDHLPQTGFSHSGSPMTRKKIENIPIVSGAYIPPVEVKPEKIPKVSSSAPAWVVDMSKMPMSDSNTPSIKNNKKPGDKTCDTLKASVKSGSNSDGCKSRSSVDSDSSEKSTHKFYIDLSTLPDALAPEQNSESEASNEKKNIFSMFIDLGDASSTVKEMPARLSSSLNTKKSSKVENKTQTTKTIKSIKKSTNTSDLFEKLETLCNNPQLTISEILRVPDKPTKNGIEKTAPSEKIECRVSNNISTVIDEEPAEDESSDLFVKLSDLDKPANKSEVPKIDCTERMTRSIPDHNWGESIHTSTRSINIISSFHSENALSLNRLFPQLQNHISRSMPGSLSSRTRSPLRLGVSSSAGDREEHPSDVSEMSSIQSSMCRSVVENSTTEDTSQTSSLISNCQSRLGLDLLRMFVEEIATDVIVEVSGRRIKAHKCILSSRCQYFAGILSGGWVESAGNVIALPPFSFNVVHFVLCHIYSGVSTIPDSISIVELATISDMLGLEGLKEAIMFTLKAKYCHHFHKPCRVCTVGVLECFPLSSVYGLDELYRRCLRWVTKHFHKVWPTKAFATLPSELLDKCYQEHILNLTMDNMIDTVYGCGITVSALPSSRWADVVARMCRRLVNAVAQFAGARLSAVLGVLSRATAKGAPPAGAHALVGCLASAVEWAHADELCRTYAALVDLADDSPKPDLIADGAPRNSLAHVHAPAMRRRCEELLVRAAPRVLDSPTFKQLPTDLRRRLRYLMRRYVSWSHPPPALSPSASARACTAPRVKEEPSMVDIEHVRNSFVPYALRPVQTPAVQVNGAAPPRVRTTKAQEERAKFNMIKSSTAKSQEKLNGKPKARVAYGNTKPRYLEPKKEPAPNTGSSVRKQMGKMISSSESSRNSSPVLARAARGARGEREARGVRGASRDSLASRPRTADPSTDSLSDSLNTNKYATYTKAKRTIEGSAPITQPPKSNAAQMKAKVPTKIPVYKAQITVKSNITPNQTNKDTKRPTLNDRIASKSSPLLRRANELKPSGSLMMATKSSSAKMVPKIVKNAKNDGNTKAKQRPRSPAASDIPIMERSGTFLKDEPTFGETTNIDIDE